ncbi:MAG: DNA recombination protein RmuC [Prolixibacteraceae bacterium]|nr:DNA recombination protein RmuC [Prolixibacteraceae bacterium]
MNLILLIFVPLVIALLLVLFFLMNRQRLKQEHAAAIRQLESEHQMKMNAQEQERLVDAERLSQLRTQIEDLNHELAKLSEKNTLLERQFTRSEAENNFLNTKLKEQASEFERLQKQAILEFENLANRILKQNSEEFSTVNHQKINELIQPLREKIVTFEKKVEETYEKGLKDQTDIKAELKKLYDLNQRISTEANNLTRALKGDVKQQGNWGEIVLERILERSGLTEGNEFEREKVVQSVEGKIIRPDVVVNLPDKKHIIIDSKVSLIAYERFVNAEEPALREKYIREHLASLKAHVKGLNEKHYSNSPQFNTPDFVLLFIPIESSFSVAVEQDQQLFNYAWDNKVVLVSPSTLLATLRTVASIWQQENQTRNALEIARQGGALYDKFVGFITDMDKLGKNIASLQGTYDDASKKLYYGAGNLVRRVENLKELGASTSKEIPDKFKAE